MSVVQRSIGAQIQEVERELALRERVYSRETNPKKGTENAEHMIRMECVLRTLRWLQTNEVRIKALLAPPDGPNEEAIQKGIEARDAPPGAG